MHFFEYAGVGETLRNALTIMGITFAALVMLLLLVKAFTYIIGLFTGKQQLRSDETPDPAKLTDSPEIQSDGGAFSAGTLISKNVDEKTIAMIMAIVADESDIPLERLIFHSIKLVSEGR